MNDDMRDVIKYQKMAFPTTLMYLAIKIMADVE